jgi:hypothetical protein
MSGWQRRQTHPVWIIVFSLRTPGALLRVLRGDGRHTMIAEEAPKAKEVGS